LLDADVRNRKDEALGSVHDLVMDPQTGKIAFLIISRGGIFGIGEKFVPVPWADFKATENMNLLVLDTSKTAMQSAPELKNDVFAAPGQYGAESQAVDTYWKANLQPAN
jgi:sporulation protein YlmC with PRC-barrel domain